MALGSVSTCAPVVTNNVRRPIVVVALAVISAEKDCMEGSNVTGPTVMPLAGPKSTVVAAAIQLVNCPSTVMCRLFCC